MVGAFISLLATSTALVGAWSLAVRTHRERRIYLLVWTITLAGLGIALGAMTVGFGTGFSPALFRGIELGGALLAPVWLAVGVVELVARLVQARFLARLFAISYVIVAVVVVLLDPVNGSFDHSLPRNTHFSHLPLLLLDIGHLFAIVILVSCVGITAFRARVQDRETLAVMLTVAMVATGGVFVVAAARGYLPGPASPFALGAAAGLVWLGVTRFLYRTPLTMKRNPRLSRMAPAAPPPPASAAPPRTRPGMHGRLIIYTIQEGSAEIFDRLADDLTRSIEDYEPGALIFTWHWVPNAAIQRINYQLFKDRAAMDDHERYPHAQWFAEQSEQHIAAMNVIELIAGATSITLPMPANAVRLPNG